MSNLRYNAEWYSMLAAKALGQLNHGVDLYAVLRGHLWLEKDVKDLLHAGGIALVKGSWPRMNLARTHKLLDEKDCKFIVALKKVRNQFAHDLERENLTSDEDDELFFASPEVVRTLYVSLTADVEEAESSRAEGLRFRGLMAAMHIHLLQRITDTKARLH